MILDGNSTVTILAKEPIHNIAAPSNVINPEDFSPNKDGMISPTRKAYSASLRTVLDTPELQRIVQKKTEEVAIYIIYLSLYIFNIFGYIDIRIHINIYTFVCSIMECL